MQTKYLCVLIHIWINGEVGTVKPVKPSSKIFYWPFQGGTSFVDLLWVFSVLCLLFLCERLFISACGHLLGKSWPLVSCLWCPSVSLPLSHWYPGSGVLLDCVDSWSLHLYLLWLTLGELAKRECDSYPFCYCRFKCDFYLTLWFLSSSTIAIFDPRSSNPLLNLWKTDFYSLKLMTELHK